MASSDVDAEPRRQYVVAAYAALATEPGVVLDESAFYASLRANPAVGGFEVPFREPWRDADVRRMADFVGINSRLMLTTIPGVMSRMAVAGEFGLASTDPKGRAAAVDFVARARDSVLAFNDHVGRAAFAAVSVASAPTRSVDGHGSNRACLEDSLATILAWPWDGAQVVLEHCDARVAWHPPVKGFLPIADEVAAIVGASRTAGGAAGICINWGRSVIESRECVTPVEHIAVAQAAGVLAGVVFSGCSPENTPYGPAWADAHLPPVRPGSKTGVDSKSLLSHHEMVRCMRQIGGRADGFIGLKVATVKGADLATRIGIVQSSLDALRQGDLLADGASIDGLGQ